MWRPGWRIRSRDGVLPSRKLPWNGELDDRKPKGSLCEIHERLLMMKCIDRLLEHQQLERRQRDADVRLAQVHNQLKERQDLFQDRQVAAYLSGSLGRGDVGKLSDLDLFLITTKPDSERKWLDDLEILSFIMQINKCLEYGPFSNDGKYLKVYSLDNMLEALGAPQDDSENLFTARMLLLLESRCVCNQSLYDDVVDRILRHYFRDSRGKSTFRPLFLLNDLLRYWRTLCLNYELIRDNPSRPWRKKNINLKFSRMLTIFGTVLPIITKQIHDIASAREFVKLSPHRRFACGLDFLEDDDLNGRYGIFLNDYDRFLCLKEEMKDNQEFPENEHDQVRDAASRYSGFIYRALTHERIEPEYRRYLVL